MTPLQTAPKSDAVLEQAVDVARTAAIEEGGEAWVGDHLGVVMEDERLARHTFACTSSAYVGWHWSVTLARAPRSKAPTVCEVVLLPGPEAILAPIWVPWSERVRPGDLGVGDVLPTAPDDIRLAPGFTGEADLDGLSSPSPLTPGQWELGLGRVRVLSTLGRDEAAHRWQEGDTGPNAAMARHASLTCGSCGFYLTIGGAMGQAFGICANALGAADGRVVATSYGCGAHSEVHVDESVANDQGPQGRLVPDGDRDSDELGHS